MNDFTILVPIKGTNRERVFMHDSLMSALKLEPDELMIAVDKPTSLTLEGDIHSIVQLYKGKKPNLKIVRIAKSDDWNFHLAKIVWECYQRAKYDKIYHYDIDSVVKRAVLKGKDQLKNDVALVSFTKQLHIASISDLIRFFFYRIRVKTNENVFSGNYWVDRTKFFEVVDKEEYQKINNGIDTYLTEKLRQSRYTMIYRKEMGVRALSKQNEDYDWRQFMDGVWYFANRERILMGKIKRGVINKNIFRKHPKLTVMLKSTAYQRFGILRGWNWASKNIDNNIVKLAGTMDLYEWSLLGTKHLPKLKFKDTGTGHHEY